MLRRVLLAGTLVAAVGLVLSAPSSAASKAGRSGVHLVQAPPVNLAVPRDDRFDTYGVSAEVLGVAKVLRGNGTTEWVFGLRWSVTRGLGAKVQATLVTNGIRTLLPIPPRKATASQSSDIYWTADEPSSVKSPDLEIDSGGFVQSFSLQQMRRIGSQPPA